MEQPELEERQSRDGWDQMGLKLEDGIRHRWSKDEVRWQVLMNHSATTNETRSKTRQDWTEFRNLASNHGALFWQSCCYYRLSPAYKGWAEFPSPSHVSSLNLTAESWLAVWHSSIALLTNHALGLQVLVCSTISSYPHFLSCSWQWQRLLPHHHPLLSSNLQLS